jgi:hypothetical protein
MGPQEENPVYKYLNHERNNRNILDFMLSSTFMSSCSQRRTQSERFLMNNTHSPNFRAFSKRQSCKTTKQVESFRSKGETIYHNAESVAHYLKSRKSKLSILGKYNDTVERYCKFVPKTYEQN